MTSLTVVLPLPPNIANGRMHWRAKYVARGKYMDACDASQAAEGFRHRWNPGHTTPNHEHATLKFGLYVGAQMDHDNALSRVKWPVDWLVAAGYLVDDSPKHCTMSIPHQVITRKKPEQKVIIVITYEDADAGMIATDLTYGTKP